jgi:glycosyltransferase involved in cell wall biosynthesis
MRVLIDATGITREKAGVGVYAKNLLNCLTRSHSDLDLYILAQDDDPEMDFEGRKGVTMIWVPACFFRILPLRFLLEQLFVPFLQRRHRIAVVHSLHYAFPLWLGARRVVTFHDMTFYTMPELHQRIKVLYFRFFMRRSVKQAENIIFISRSTLEDCVARLGQPTGKMWVVPHGKGEAYRTGISLTSQQQVKQLYALGDRFVLYIGTLEPRKNLDRLVEAFSVCAARDPSIQLVIAGKKGWMQEKLNETIERLGLAARIVFTGFVAEEDKAPLIAASTVFVYPSLYEGFGLPALEAIACGVPTITSNLSSLPEVVGDAALLIDPTSTSELTEALERLLLDPLLRADYQQRGPLQAAAFTWERTAGLTALVYRSAAKQGSSQ